MDSYLFQQINQYAGKWLWLDKLAVFFVRYFEFFLILILAVVLFLDFNKYWPVAVQGLVAAVFSRFVITVLIQLFWQRPRPYVEHRVNTLFNYNPLFAASFPSGHAVFYFALSAVIYFYSKEIGAFFLAGTFLISLARVFAGLHWPTDVLAGAAIGILSAWLVVAL